MQYKIDFRKVREASSIRDVMARYGIELRETEEGMRGKCPLPSHTSKKDAQSFSVHAAKGLWACGSNSCAHSRDGKKGGDVISFVAYMDGTSMYEAAVKLAGWFLSAGVSPEPKPEPRAKAEATKNPEGELNPPLAFTLKNVDYGHPEVLKRIPREVAEKYGIGMMTGKGSMAGRIVIPIHNAKGDLVAYAGRSVNGEEPRYKLPGGFRKGLVLWNDQNVEGSSCVVTEGFFGCIAVSEAGYPCVATMGCEVSAEQTGMLAKFERVCIFFDGDEPGRKAAGELLQKLCDKTYVRVVCVNGKQPDELSRDEIKNLLA